MAPVRNTPKKANVRMSFVEQKWKPIFALVEKGRLRRGRAAVKQLEMTKVSGNSQATCFSVRSSGFGSGVYEVILPTFADESQHLPQIARLLAERPDWLAACLNGQWDSEFLQRVEATGIHLFPDEHIANQLKWSVRCTCQDFDPFCVHVVTVLTKLMTQMEAKPLSAFAWAGILTEELLDMTHVLSIEWIHDKFLSDEVKQNESNKAAPPQTLSTFIQNTGKFTEILNRAETEGLQRGRFAPVMNAEKLKKILIEYT